MPTKEEVYGFDPSLPWEMVEQPIEEVELLKKLQEADEEEEFVFSEDRILYDPDEEKENETRMWEKMQNEAQEKKLDWKNLKDDELFTINSYIRDEPRTFGVVKSFRAQNFLTGIIFSKGKDSDRVLLKVDRPSVQKVVSRFELARKKQMVLLNIPVYLDIYGVGKQKVYLHQLQLRPYLYRAWNIVFLRMPEEQRGPLLPSNFFPNSFVPRLPDERMPVHVQMVRKERREFEQNMIAQIEKRKQQLLALEIKEKKLRDFQRLQGIKRSIVPYGLLR